MQLIVSLHEGLVVSTADGYHRMSGKPAFLNLHVIAGTAQAAGQMYNAARDGSALVVTAGLNDNEMWSDEGTLAPRPGYDQKDVNRQFTKISWEAREPRSLALMVRRAFKAATMAPGGPVYLAMAHHALEAKGVEQGILPGKRFIANARPRPARDAVEKAARMLVEARNPMLVAGDEVWKAGAQDDLIRLSEALGLPVSYLLQGYWNFPSRHPHYVGRFSMNSAVAKRGMDVVMSVGAPDFGGRVVPRRAGSAARREVRPHGHEYRQPGPQLSSRLGARRRRARGSARPDGRRGVADDRRPPRQNRQAALGAPRGDVAGGSAQGGRAARQWRMPAVSPVPRRRASARRWPATSTSMRSS